MSSQNAEAIKQEIPTLVNKYQDTKGDIKMRGLIAELSRMLKPISDIEVLTLARNVLDDIIEWKSVEWDKVEFKQAEIKNKLIEIESLILNKRKNTKGGGPKVQLNY